MKWEPRMDTNREDAYPDGDMFGVLPAHGIYARHARNLRNIALERS